MSLERFVGKHKNEAIGLRKVVRVTEMTSIVRRFGGRFAALVACSALAVTLSGAAPAADRAAPAAEQPGYGLTADAERVGESVQVSLRVTKTNAEGKAETLAAPRLRILEGHRGIIIIGGSAAPGEAAPLPPVQANPTINAPQQAPAEAAPRPPAQADPTAPAAPDRRPAASGGPLEPGVRVDVVSVKGDGEIVIVATAVEDGVTVWCDVRKVAIRPGPEAK